MQFATHKEQRRTSPHSPRGSLACEVRRWRIAPALHRRRLRARAAQPQDRLQALRPYHPQTCGKAGRFHQTLKKFLARQDPAHTKKQLQAQLDRFAAYYNQTRPHRALGRRTPAAAFAAREKAYPTGPRIDATGYRVRHDKLDKKPPSPCGTWSGWPDSNRRPPAPKAGALTKLRHIPWNRTVAYPPIGQAPRRRSPSRGVYRLARSPAPGSAPMP
jgi:hypothetical protein